MSCGAPTERGWAAPFTAHWATGPTVVRERSWLPAFLIATSLFTACGLPGAAWGASEEREVRRVRVSSVEVARTKVGFQLTIRGQAPRVPAGTVVDFVFAHHSSVIETISASLDLPGEFVVAVSSRELRVTPGRIRLRTVIRSDGQSEAVRERLSKDRQAFPTGRSAWTDHQLDCRIELGTPEEVAEVERRIREFFVSCRKALLEVDQSLDRAGRELESGQRFRAEGKFNAAAWRAWFGEHVRGPLLEQQAQIKSAFDDLEFATTRASLIALHEIAIGVAARSMERQRKLFEGLREPLLESDHKIPELDQSPLSHETPTDRYLEKIWQRIARELGLPVEGTGSSEERKE